MSSIMVEVESRIVDGNPDLMGLEPVPIELETTEITVEDLIRRTVHEQVDGLMRRKIGEAEAQRALARQYLSQGEVEKQARMGSIRARAKVRGIPRISVESEIKKAVQAFENGVYVVLVNGRQVDSLDETLTLQEANKIAFVRLMPLAGG